jgi:hypothetical protein
MVAFSNLPNYYAVSIRARTNIVWAKGQLFQKRQAARFELCGTPTAHRSSSFGETMRLTRTGPLMASQSPDVI